MVTRSPTACGVWLCELPQLLLRRFIMLLQYIAHHVVTVACNGHSPFVVRVVSRAAAQNLLHRLNAHHSALSAQHRRIADPRHQRCFSVILHRGMLVDIWSAHCKRARGLFFARTPAFDPYTMREFGHELIIDQRIDPLTDLRSDLLNIIAQ